MDTVLFRAKEKLALIDSRCLYINSSFTFNDSVILKTQDQRSFVNSLVTKHGNKANLLYRGTKDGWGCDEFHSKCDSKGPTLILFKTNSKRVCGGFTEAKWDRSGDYKEDARSFLFSVDLKLYFPVLDPTKAIYCKSDQGPTFGFNNDLSAYSAPFDNALNCCSRPGYPSYKVAAELNGKSVLTGTSSDFTSVEIEVYEISTA